jgi:hypothetical protein
VDSSHENSKPVRHLTIQMNQTDVIDRLPAQKRPRSDNGAFFLELFHAAFYRYGLPALPSKRSNNKLET